MPENKAIIANHMLMLFTAWRYYRGAEGPEESNTPIVYSAHTM